MKIIVMINKVIFALFIVNACASTTSTIPSIHVPSLRESYPFLLVEAQKWEKDAYLAYVDIDSQGRGGALSAIFGSLSNKKESLYITVTSDSKSVTSELYKSEVPLIYQTPILEEDWNIDSVSAMELFLAENDIQELWLEFPERCSDLGLRHFWVNNEFVLAWVLTISDCLELKHTYYFYLDPFTGERLNLSY